MVLCCLRGIITGYIYIYICILYVYMYIYIYMYCGMSTIGRETKVQPAKGKVM